MAAVVAVTGCTVKMIKAYCLNLFLFMNTKILLSIFLLFITLSSGCIGSKLTEQYPVLYVDFTISGTYEKPNLDTSNATRHVEFVPLLKLPKNKNVVAPLVYSDVFYNQDKISITSIEPYHGPGNYTIKITFKDDIQMPTSSNDVINVLIGIVDSNGAPLLKEYVGVRWSE